MTLRELASTLADAGIDSAKSDTLLIAEKVSGIGRASLMARFDEDISALPWYAEAESMISRRASREPLQYILGKWEFYGDVYTVTPACLIPRPETEMLVDYARGHLPRGARIADLCCGSGCIGVAVCRNTDAHCDSVDISKAALGVAIENAESLGVSGRIRFHRGDVLSSGAIPGEYDMILSNPPYVKTSELYDLEPELSFEPMLALDGGDDGMIFYRAIVENYKEKLTENGEFVFEIGAGLGGDMTELAHSYGFECRIYNDLSGLPRMAVLGRRKI